MTKQYQQLINFTICLYNVLYKQREQEKRSANYRQNHPVERLHLVSLICIMSKDRPVQIKTIILQRYATLN